MTTSGPSADVVELESSAKEGHDHSDNVEANSSALEAADPQEPSTQVLAIASDVPDIQTLIDSAKDGVIIIVYDSNEASLSDISGEIFNLLNGRLANSIAFVNHGSDGQFSLTNEANVSSETLVSSADLQQFWKDIGSMVQDNGRVDLLACDFAAEGDEALKQIDNLLDSNGKNIDVAASDDRTSSENLLGDWYLEYGDIDVEAQYFYSGMLDSYDGILDGVININPSGNSNPENFIEFNGKLFFTANDGTHGEELWMSDGTQAGTQMVSDIRPGSFSSNPFYLTVFDGELYFSANDNVNGTELWKTDGTAAGTVLVTETNTLSSSLPQLLTVVDTVNVERLFFIARDSTGHRDLYSIDTNDNLTSHNVTASDLAFASHLTDFNQQLFFEGRVDEVPGHEFFRFDPATNILHSYDIHPTLPNAFIGPMTAYNGELFFSARDNVSGQELFKYSPTSDSVTLVADISSNAANPRFLRVVNGLLLFIANGPSGSELYSTDGTTMGTRQVADIDLSSEDVPLVVGDYYFLGVEAAKLANNGIELLRSDATTAINEFVTDLATGSANSSPEQLEAHGNVLYFTASDGTTDHIWIYDGSTNTAQVFQTPGTNIEDLKVAGNELFLTVRGSSPGYRDLVAYSLTAENTEAPVSQNHVFAVNQEISLQVDAANGVLSNVTDADGTNSFNARLVSHTSHGLISLNRDGSFNYQPNPTFTGTDSFTYLVDDGILKGNISTVTLTVDPIAGTTVETTVYSEDFQGASPDLSNWSSVSNPGASASNVGSIAIESGIAPGDTTENFLGFFGNQTVSLGLTGITVPHNAIKISFDFIVQGSWEGSGLQELNLYGPDTFLLQMDGIEILNATFANRVSGPAESNQSYANNYPFGSFDENTGAASIFNLGYESIDSSNTFHDATYRFEFIVPHSSTDFTADFQGLLSYTRPENPSDPGAENFALDNVVVTAIQYDADLSTSISLNDTVVDPGDTTSFDLIISNDGPGNSLSGTVELRTPLNGLVPTSLPTGFSYNSSTNELTFSGISANKSISISFTGQVPIEFINGTLAVEAEVIAASDTDPDSTPNNNQLGEDDQDLQLLTVNQPPVAANDTFNLLEDGSFSGNVKAGDSDPNTGDLAASTVALVGAPPANAAAFNLNADGTFTYTPLADYHGSSSFQYQLTDPSGRTSNIATVTLIVDPVNDAPIFTLPANHTSSEDAGPQTIANFVTGIDDGDPTQTQTLSFSVSNDNNGLFTSQPSIDSSGQLTYEAAADQHGTATVTVTLTDGGGTANGGSDTTTKTFTITIEPVNDAPVFTLPTNHTSNEDAGPQTIANFVTGIDDGDPTQTQALSFSVSNDNNSLFSSQPSINSSGQLTYEAAADQHGTATVTVTLTDGGGTGNGGSDTTTKTFIITVAPVNDAPVFTLSANHTSNEDAGPQTIANFVTGIDDGDPTQTQTLSFSVSNDNNGLFSSQPTIDSSGQLTYEAAADQHGTATATVTLTDGGGTGNGGTDSTTKTFTITVAPVNDAPTITLPATHISNEDAGAQTIANFATNISSGSPAEAQSLTITLSGYDSSLFAVDPFIALDGSLNYTAAADAFGTTTVTVTLSDDGGTGNGGLDTFTTTFDLLITSVNDAPTFTIGSNVTVTTAGPQVISGFLTDMMPGASNEIGQTFTIITTNNAPGLFNSNPAIDGSGQLTFNTVAGASGVVNVEVTIQDDGGSSNGGTDRTVKSFTININPLSDFNFLMQSEDSEDSLEEDELLLPTIPKSSSVFDSDGFIKPDGTSQLTSNGDSIGFDHLNFNQQIDTDDLITSNSTSSSTDLQDDNLNEANSHLGIHNLWTQLNQILSSMTDDASPEIEQYLEDSFIAPDTLEQLIDLLDENRQE